MEAKNPHFDIEAVKHVVSQLFDHFSIKGIISLIFLLVSWVFDGKVESLAIIYLLIFIDTFTGLQVAIQQKNISSNKFYRVVTKCAAYFTMMMVSRLVDKTLPLAFASPIMDSFLVTTEAFSILENFSKLGYPVPTILVNKLKSYYEKKE
jgi:toxin secretion/phage lysis holin